MYSIPGGHDSKIINFALSPNGRIAASTTHKFIYIWDLSSTNLIHKFDGECGWASVIWNVAFSPDGRYLLTCCGQKNGYGCCAKLWDLSNYQLIRSFHGHDDSVFAIAYSPDGKYIASGDMCCKIFLWDIESGNLLHILDKHQGGVFTLAFSPDGQYLISGGGNYYEPDFPILLWQVKSGELVGKFEGHEDRVRSAVFSSDGSLMASASEDGTARLWRVEDRRELLSFIGHTGDLHSINFSPDNQKIVTGGADKTVRIWDLQTNNEQCSLSGHGGEVYHTVFTPYGGKIVSASKDSSIRIWDIDRETCLSSFGRLANLTALELTFSEAIAITGDKQGMIISVDLETGQELTSYEGHQDSINRILKLPNGMNFISSSSDGTLRFWQFDHPKEIYYWKAHEKGICDFAVSPDGTKAVTAGRDRKIRLWNLEKGCKILQRKFKNIVGCVAFSPNGDLVIFSNWNKLYLWDINENRVLAILEGHTKPIKSIAISSDGRSLLSASMDGSVKLWDLEKARCCKIFSGFNQYPWDVKFSPKTNYALINSVRTVHLLDINDGNEVFRSSDCPGYCNFFQDSKRIISFGDGIKIWSLPESLCLTQ